jgi:hypothetical protein
MMVRLLMISCGMMLVMLSSFQMVLFSFFRHG